MESAPGKPSRKRKLSAATSASQTSITQSSPEHDRRNALETVMSMKSNRRGRGVAEAAINGLIRARQPSLAIVEQEESRLVSLARSRINRFLRFCIAKRRNVPSPVVFAALSSHQPLKRHEYSSFTSWLPHLLTTSQSAALRRSTVDLLMNVLRSSSNEWDVVEQAFFLFMRTNKVDGLVTLTHNLNDINSKDLWRRALRIGVLRSCQAKLELVVEAMVASELRVTEPPTECVRMLSELVVMIRKLTGECSPAQAMDLHLVGPVVMLESLQLGSVLVGSSAKQLRAIRDGLNKSPESVVKETGKALVQLVPQLTKNHLKCSFQAAALKILLTDVMNVVVPKHKVPDIGMQLQRASTQDEYFRSGLPMSNLTLTEVPCANKENNSPLVSDLKAKIASDLGMSSSLEMFELVCVNKILGPDLELSRVFEQIWRPHVASRSRTVVASSRRRGDHYPTGSHAGSGVRAVLSSAPRSLIAQLHETYRSRTGDRGGNTLGGVLYRSLRDRMIDPNGQGVLMTADDDEEIEEDGLPESDVAAMQLQDLIIEEDDDDGDDDEEEEEGAATRNKPGNASPARTLVTMIPAMAITYRLCAVDGEATEDFVSSLPPSATDEKKEFYSSTSEYGDAGLRSLIQVVAHCCDNLKSWPSGTAKDLLTLTLGALDHAVNVNGPALLKLGALPVLLRCLVDLGESAASSLCLSVVDRLVSGQSEDFEENAFEYSIAGGRESGQSGGDQLEWVLERLDSFAHKPKLVNALSRLVPHLIYGRLDKARQLAEELIAKKDKPWSLLVIENLSVAPDAILLRDALFELGLPRKCVQQINQSTMETLLEHAALPETQLSLRMLRGLVKGHHASAMLVCEGPCLSSLVKMEEISSTKVEHVGANAFAVLEALSSPSSSPAVRDAVTRVQKQRQEELRMMASKKRNRAMKSLVAKQQPMQPAAASSSSSSKKQKRWMDELKTLEEEDSSLVCIVCHEGYKSKPNQLMCVYTFQKAVPLHQGASFLSGSGNVRRAAHNSHFVLCSASSFVCIHQICHESAARADRSHPKAPKDEWEGAELRNSHVRCNNLMPLKGAVVRPLYDAALHAFFERADRDTRIKLASASFTTDPSFFSIICHDLRILLLRASFGESFSEDTRGGSLESNLKLVVPLLQMGRALLGPDTRGHAETALASFLSGSSDMSSLDWSFACILALFLLSETRWEECRMDHFLALLPAHVSALALAAASGDMVSLGSGTTSNSALGITLGTVGPASGAVPTTSRARNRSRARSLSVAAAEVLEELKADSVPVTLRPWLCFVALVDEIKRTQREDLPDGEALALANALADRTRQVHAATSSLTAIAGVFRIDSEALRKLLASRSRSQSFASKSPAETALT